MTPVSVKPNHTRDIIDRVFDAFRAGYTHVVTMNGYRWPAVIVDSRTFYIAEDGIAHEIEITLR